MSAAEHPEPGSPLPEPDLIALGGLFTDRETAEAARFLLERRENPPTMAEWIDRSRQIFGKTNAQTQRRLRSVRSRFVVETVRHGRESRYRITGWNPITPEEKAERISPRLQAEVFTAKGRFCAMCGRGPVDGVKLQIDHKLPRAWGGKTEFDNLEPLCDEHNNGKKAFFASLDPYGAVIKQAMALPTPWERIGEALKLLAARGEQLPAAVLPIIGRESHSGDPARRLRDLRVVLGWDIRARKRRQGARTVVSYELLSWKPWPAEGAGEAVRRYERERKKKKAKP
jgi:5-methylcytosine-specific restriction endonuclease McrA